jgi:hypothetical protein
MMFTVRRTIENLGLNMASVDSAMVETFRKAITGIAKGAQAEWIRLAEERLNTSRTDYINGLRQAESFDVAYVDGEPFYTIQLVGRMPNNFEFGMDPFDMKEVRPGWLGGAKAKMSKDGNAYLRIPFRHSTSSDSSLGYSGKALIADLRSELRRAVREYGLNRMVRSATGAPMTGPVKRIARNADVHPYLKGLTRIQEVHPTRAGKAKVSGRLMTWRTISEKSEADAWQHPGIQAANLLPEVERWVDSQMVGIVSMVMEAADV